MCVSLFVPVLCGSINYTFRRHVHVLIRNIIKIHFQIQFIQWNIENSIFVRYIHEFMTYQD